MHLILDLKNYEFSEVPFSMYFNDFLHDIPSEVMKKF